MMTFAAKQRMNRAIASAKAIFKTPEGARMAGAYLLAACLKWKIEHGERNPASWIGGLLTPSFDFDKAKPYQCRTPACSCYADLADALLEDQYQPMVELAGKMPKHVMAAAALLAEAADDPVDEDAFWAGKDIFDGVLLLKPAITGWAFKRGRKQGAYSPVKKWIKRQLLKNLDLKPAELWGMFNNKSVRGWTAVVPNGNIGKYIEAPTGSKDMPYKRFQDAVSEVKRALKRG